MGVPLEAVTPEMRSRAKAINFGIVYGMGAQSLAQQIKVTMAQAEEFIESYFRIYPNVRAYEEKVVEEARRTGSVTTLMGRRRPLPDDQRRRPAHPQRRPSASPSTRRSRARRPT